MLRIGCFPDPRSYSFPFGDFEGKWHRGTEDDLLYMRSLPTFNEMLRASDSEVGVLRWMEVQKTIVEYGKMMELENSTRAN